MKQPHNKESSSAEFLLSSVVMKNTAVFLSALEIQKQPALLGTTCGISGLPCFPGISLGPILLQAQNAQENEFLSDDPTVWLEKTQHSEELQRYDASLAPFLLR